MTAQNEERLYRFTTDLEHILLQRAASVSESLRHEIAIRRIAMSFLEKGDTQNALKVLKSGDEYYE
jgi:hypothetical protein